MEQYLLFISVIALLFYLSKKLNNQSISTNIAQVLQAQNILMTLALITSLFAEKIQTYFVNISDQYLLSNIIFLNLIFTLTFMYYAQVFITGQIKALKTYKTVDFQFKQIPIINALLFILVLILIFVKNYPYFFDQQDFHKYPVSVLIFSEIRQTYLSIYIVYVQLNAIPFVIETLIENPIKRMRKIFKKKQDLPFYESYFYNDSKEQKYYNNNSSDEEDYGDSNNLIFQSSFKVPEKTKIQNNQPQKIQKQKFNLNFIHIIQNQFNNLNNKLTDKIPKKNRKIIKKTWLFIQSSLELLMITSTIYSLFLLLLEIFYPEQKQFWQTSLEFQKIFGLNTNHQYNQEYVDLYKLTLKISLYIYIIGESLQTLTQKDKKNLIKTYRNQQIFKKYLKIQQIFLLTLILSIILYPSIFLFRVLQDKNTAFSCVSQFQTLKFQPNFKQLCPFTYIGYTTVEIIQGPFMYYIQIGVLIYALLFAIFKMFVNIFKKN